MFSIGLLASVQKEYTENTRCVQICGNSLEACVKPFGFHLCDSMLQNCKASVICLIVTTLETTIVNVWIFLIMLKENLSNARPSLIYLPHCEPFKSYNISRCPLKNVHPDKSATAPPPLFFTFHNSSSLTQASRRPRESIGARFGEAVGIVGLLIFRHALECSQIGRAK